MNQNKEKKIEKRKISLKEFCMVAETVVLLSLALVIGVKGQGKIRISKDYFQDLPTKKIGATISFYIYFPFGLMLY